jgi:hypothetical protein
MAINTNSVTLLATILAYASAGDLKTWELEVLHQAQNQNRGDMNVTLGRMMERANELSVELGCKDRQVQSAWERVELQRALLDAEDERLEVTAERVAYEAMMRNESRSIHRDWLSTALEVAYGEASDKALKGLPRTFGCNAPRIHRTAEVRRVMGAQVVANVSYCHFGSSRGGSDVVAFPGSYLGNGKYLAVVKNDQRWEILTWTWELKLPNREEVLAGKKIPASWATDSDDV